MLAARRQRTEPARATTAVSADLASLVSAAVEERVMRHGELLAGQQRVHVFQQGLELGAAEHGHHRVQLHSPDAVGAQDIAAGHDPDSTAAQEPKQLSIGVWSGAERDLEQVREVVQVFVPDLQPIERRPARAVAAECGDGVSVQRNGHSVAAVQVVPSRDGRVAGKHVALLQGGSDVHHDPLSRGPVGGDLRSRRHSARRAGHRTVPVGGRAWSAAGYDEAERQPAGGPDQKVRGNTRISFSLESPTPISLLTASTQTERGCWTKLVVTCCRKRLGAALPSASLSKTATSPKTGGLRSRLPWLATTISLFVVSTTTCRTLLSRVAAPVITRSGVVGPLASRG